MLADRLGLSPVPGAETRPSVPVTGGAAVKLGHYNSLNLSCQMPPSGAMLPGLSFDASSAIRCRPDFPNPFTAPIHT
jgi:hypothetical protein